MFKIKEEAIMPELNKANRQVCDVDIRILKTKEPFLFLDTANTTTVGLTGDAVYATKKGVKAIAFHNPIEGTMTIEAQVVPFKFYTLLSDGVVETTGIKAMKTTVKATDAGKITLPTISNGSYKAGTVFVYKENEFGNDAIDGTFTLADGYVVADTYVSGTTYYTESSGTYTEATGISGFTAGTTYYTKVPDASGIFTATTAGDIVVGSEYEVGYIVSKTSGVKRVSFNNKRTPQDYYITMSTVDKDEEGVLTPFFIIAYKASIQRDFELSFSSEGDPATFSLTLIKNIASVYSDVYDKKSIELLETPKAA